MAMYFAQHGLARAKADDPKQGLSPEGSRETASISDCLRKMGITVKRVCHSGKTRTAETARIFAENIGSGRTDPVPGMAPKDVVARFASTLEDDTMYVGHLPHMEKLVSYLVTGNEDSGVVKFANSAVVCVEKGDAGVYIDWFLKPSMCTL